jgi:hypothetical protein
VPGGAQAAVTEANRAALATNNLSMTFLPK